MPMTRRCPFVFALLLLFLSAAPAGAKGPSTVSIEFHRAVINLEDLQTRLSPEPTPRVRVTPEAAPGAELWYGEIFRQLPGDAYDERGHNVPFAVEFRGTTIVRAWCDANLNGNLRDDAAPVLHDYPGPKPARSFLSDLTWTAHHDGRDIPVDRLTRVVLDIPDSTGPSRFYRTQEVYGQLGALNIAGATRAVLLFDGNHDGLYTRGHSDGMFVDLEGDRRFTIDPMAPDFGPFAIPFTLGGTSYAVEDVDPRGTTVTLRSQGSASDIPPPAVGEAMPDFSFTDSAGRPERLSSHRGTVVILYFWASWCGGCRRHADDLTALYGRYPRNQLEILGVSYDVRRGEGEQFRKEHGQTWPTSFQGGIPPEDPVGRLCRETGVGVFYVIGPDGKLVAREFTMEKLEDAIRGLLPRDSGSLGAR